MKKLFARTCALAVLSLVSPLRSVQAQTAAGATRHAGPFSYDITLESKLNGTVSSVLTKPAPGMIMGSHLLLTTLSSPLDISLGAFGLRDKGALIVLAGQQVEVTGIMKTFKDKPVFLARTVRVGNQLYTIRNEHGIPVSPQARERTSQKAAQSGETL